MKILYCAGTPLAGVAELMTRCVNEYLAPEHEARCLSRGPGRHKWYTRPGARVPRYDINNGHDVDDQLHWADVIHCMANVSARTMKRLDLLRKKIWVFQWHGAQVWPFERVWLPEDYQYVRWTHIGQGWNRAPWFRQFEPFGFQILPNLITVDDELHSPLPWRKRTPGLVAFAPSTSKPGAVNNKGIPEVLAASAGGVRFRLDMIQGASFEECLRRKRIAQLGIDEVVTPFYHRSGLEFLSQGTPCICSYDDFTAATLKEATGSSTVPFIGGTPQSLDVVVRRVLGQPPVLLEAEGMAARDWIRRYYHPKTLLQQYLAVYSR